MKKPLLPLALVLAVALPVAQAGDDGHDHEGHAHEHSAGQPHEGKPDRAEAPVLQAGPFRFHVHFDDDCLKVIPTRKDKAAFSIEAVIAKVTLTSKDGESRELSLSPIWDSPGKLHALEIKQDFTGIADGSHLAKFRIEGLDPKPLIFSTVLSRSPHGDDEHDDHAEHPSDEAHTDHKEGHEGHGH